MAMLLILLGSYLHMGQRDDRAGWLLSSSVSRTWDADGGIEPLPLSDTTFLSARAIDYFHGDAYYTLRVAVTPHTDVTMRDGLAMPRPGEYYASPALARIIASHPTDELGDRYGTMIGTLPATMLKGPDQVVALVGASEAELQQDPGASLLTELPTKGTHADTLVFRVIVAIGSIALLAPIVLLVGIVAQLGAAARRERYATVRLIGAGRKAMASLAALEMGAASALGAVAGVGFSAALRPAAGKLPISGSQSYLADLTPSLGWTVTAVIAMTCIGAVTAWWRTYRDDAGALGATRERAEKSARAWRVVPLIVGFAMFSASAAGAMKATGGGEIILLGLALGFGLVAFGIVMAGSWLTKVASSAFARSARSAPSLVAAGRLSRHPRATFRSVAGVVIAVFIVSVLAGVVASVKGVATAKEEPGLLPLNAVLASVAEDADTTAIARAVSSTQGVTRVIVAHRAADNGALHVVSHDDAQALGVKDLPEAPWVAIDLYGMLAADYGDGSIEAPTVANAPDGLDASYVVALTTGDQQSVERARTAFVVARSGDLSPVTRTDYAGAGALRTAHQLALLAYIGMAIAVGISALSLTVATVSAALDRKRTFGLLRLSGMPVTALRKVIAIEAAVPLGVTLVASAGLGFLLAFVIIKTIGNGLYFTWPDPLYWWAMLSSLALAAAAVAASFGIVRRSTDIASTRFE